MISNSDCPCLIENVRTQILYANIVIIKHHFEDVIFIAVRLFSNRSQMTSNVVRTKNSTHFLGCVTEQMYRNIESTSFKTVNDVIYASAS